MFNALLNLYIVQCVHVRQLVITDRVYVIWCAGMFVSVSAPRWRGSSVLD